MIPKLPLLFPHMYHVLEIQGGDKVSDGDCLVSERIDDHVVTLGFNQPDKRNALDLATVSEIDKALRVYSEEPTVLVLHSTTPGMFVSGADIAELRDRTADDALRSINASLFDRLAAHRWPTIAAIDGYALGGGCELAMACDFRIATPTSTFGQPELALGILAGAGANWRLRELVGIAAARRMLFLGERVDGTEAEALGLVDATVDADALIECAIEYARRISRNSWQAVELTKLALAQNRPTTTSFDITAQALLFESDEKRERMTRFLDRKNNK